METFFCSSTVPPHLTIYDCVKGPRMEIEMDKHVSFLKGPVALSETEHNVMVSLLTDEGAFRIFQPIGRRHREYRLRNMQTYPMVKW